MTSHKSLILLEELQTYRLQPTFDPTRSICSARGFCKGPLRDWVDLSQALRLVWPSFSPESARQLCQWHFAEPATALSMAAAMGLARISIMLPLSRLANGIWAPNQGAVAPSIVDRRHAT